MRTLHVLALLPLLGAFAGGQTLRVQPNQPIGSAATPSTLHTANVTGAPAAAQTTAPAIQVTSTAAQLAARAPKAHPEDIATPQALVDATYAVISGPPGARDWDRFRSLFLPSGRLTATGVKKDGTHVITELSAEEYVTRDSPYFLKNGFFEKAVRTRIENFGSLATAFSSYESRSTPDGSPFARGINSFQMVSDGSRWWIVSIAWDEERPGLKLPADMDR